MHSIILIAAGLSEEEAPLPGVVSEIERCCVTGEMLQCVPRRLVIKDAFSNYDLLKAPGSEFVSVDAYRVLRHRPERMSSWFCDGEHFSKITRKEVREIVLNMRYPNRPWSMYVTTSYKKHGSLWTRVNSGVKRIVRFEQIDVDLSDHGFVMDTWNRIYRERMSGMSRRTIETLRCPIHVLSNHGIVRWMSFYDWALPRITSPVYNFLGYLLPSKEEEVKINNGIRLW